MLFRVYWETSVGALLEKVIYFKDFSDHLAFELGLKKAGSRIIALERLG